MEDKIIQLALTKKPSKESFNAYKKATQAYSEALSQVSLTKFNLEEAEEKLLQSILLWQLFFVAFSSITGHFVGVEPWLITINKIGRKQRPLKVPHNVFKKIHSSLQD